MRQREVNAQPAVEPWEQPRLTLMALLRLIRARDTYDKAAERDDDTRESDVEELGRGLTIRRRQRADDRIERVRRERCSHGDIVAPGEFGTPHRCVRM